MLSLVISLVIFMNPATMTIPKPITSETKLVEVIATNLDNHRSIALVDDKIYIAEKNGKIKIVYIENLVEKTSDDIDVYDELNKSGLLGFVIHPNFINNHYIYAYYTYDHTDGTLWNKIIRLTEHNDTTIDEMIILDRIPGSKLNNDGTMKLGPDGKLYVATGVHNGYSQSSQNLNSLEGKILRINNDGTIPIDNPLGNLIFSYGHGIIQGMAWDSQGNFFVSELGDIQNDEINLVLPGKNYGWPTQECFVDNNEFINPLICYDPVIELGGMDIHENDAGVLHLLVFSLRTGSIYSLKIDMHKLHSQQIMLSGVGRIRDIEIGSNNYIYVLTSNTDVQGFPSSEDDKLLRLTK